MPHTDAAGDHWLAANATYENGVWNRDDESRYAYALQFIVNGVIPGEEDIDPIGGISFWRCMPGENPIGRPGTIGGWELMSLVTEYRDMVVGGMAIEIDGAGIVPFGRVIHSHEGTYLTTNAYSDFSRGERDDPSADSLMIGMFEEAIRARFWPGGSGPDGIIDLWSVDKHGNLVVHGSVTARSFAVGGVPSSLGPEQGESGRQGSSDAGTTVRLEPWHDVGAEGEPPFLNNWANYDEGRTEYEVASFRKWPDGQVAIRGLIRGSESGPVFLLPDGYRPPRTMLFPSVNNARQGHFEVRGDGNVVASASSDGSLTLNAMFDTETVETWPYGRKA
jgi:hypothetical protein